MTYTITTQSQSVNCLNKDGHQVGVILNGPKGWIAYRAERTERVSAMGPVFAPIGEGVQVSRHINHHNGGDLIATALGL